MTTFKDFERAAWEVKAHRYQDTWGSVTQQSTDAVLDDACLTFGSRLLDCGCGPGHLCERAARRGVIVTGCDYSEKMVQIAASNYPELTFVKEDVEALTFDDCRDSQLSLASSSGSAESPSRGSTRSQEPWSVGVYCVVTAARLAWLGSGVYPSS
jgi:SAM-dependent methyltransferase